MILFHERLKLAEDFRQWRAVESSINGFEVPENTETVLAFLEAKKLLMSSKEKKDLERYNAIKRVIGEYKRDKFHITSKEEYFEKIIRAVERKGSNER